MTLPYTLTCLLEQYSLCPLSPHARRIEFIPLRCRLTSCTINSSPPPRKTQTNAYSLHLSNNNKPIYNFRGVQLPEINELLKPVCRASVRSYLTKHGRCSISCLTAKSHPIGICNLLEAAFTGFPPRLNFHFLYTFTSPKITCSWGRSND